ncbi:hypothetical protein C1645_829301 [Glomus cerebriforme]|uniref:Uncharacterized protein n=1 Tax=Glomus cerebriforme TaxID=658196 RepID=A0A397SQX9_9GLOM|nr:hypothetical protein C1645_829301 [Glomus cerebriforme]
MSKQAMAERINNRVCDSIHERQNNYSLESYRKNDILRQVPTDFGYYSLGYFSSSLDLCLSSEDARIMHVQCINSLPSASESKVSKIKGEEFEDSTVSIRYEKCSNSESIGKKLAPFGKLLRITSLRNNVQIQSGERCHFIFAHSYSAQEDASAINDQTSMLQISARNENDSSPSISDNLSILVDTFENKSRIATFIGRKILTNSEPEDLTAEYIECIAEFGFNHIIIIGEVDFGIIFLDCYERVFKWDDESQILWPLGNLKDQPKYLKKEGDWLGWIVQNGTVYEYTRKPLCTIFPDLYATAKNNTNDIKASWIDPRGFILPSHIFKTRISKVDIKNQEGSFDMENPPSIENLSIIEEEDLTNIEDVIIIKNILYEESDFSAIKSSDVTILDNGLCIYCEKLILSDNSPTSVIINVCGHIHHWTCAKEIDRREVLSYGTCHISNDNNPLILIIQTNKCAKYSVEISAESSELTMSWKKKGITFHLKCLGKGGDKRLSISTPSKALNMEDISNQLYKLYYDIDVAEKKRNQTNRDAILNYFRFGKVLSECLAKLMQKPITDGTYEVE